MMRGSTAVSGKATIGIDAPGNTPTNYTLSSSALTFTSPSGAVAPAVVTAIPSSFRWADTTATGSRTGSITLAISSDPGGDPNHTMSVSGAVLANRVLNVAAIGSSLAPVRIMARAPVTTTISSGNDPLVDGDNVATRVNTAAAARVKDGVATVSYAASQPGGALRTKFDGAGESANLAVTFSDTGPYRGKINLAPVSLGNGTMSKGLISDGEAASVGAQFSRPSCPSPWTLCKPAN